MTPGEGKAAANATRGYIVTIRGTTPNKTKGRFVESAFLQELLKYTAEQQLKLGKSWYVARAEMVQVGPRALEELATGCPGSAGCVVRFFHRRPPSWRCLSGSKHCDRRPTRQYSVRLSGTRDEPETWGPAFVI